VLRDPRTAKTWIPPLEFADQLNQLLTGPFGARLAFGMRGIQESVFEIPQPLMEAEQSGGAENDGRPQESARIEERTRKADDRWTVDSGLADRFASGPGVGV